MTIICLFTLHHCSHVWPNCKIKRCSQWIYFNEKKPDDNIQSFLYTHLGRTLRYSIFTAKLYLVIHFSFSLFYFLFVQHSHPVLDNPWLLFWKFTHWESLQCFHTGTWTRATLTLTAPRASLLRQLCIELWCLGKSSWLSPARQTGPRRGGRTESNRTSQSWETSTKSWKFLLLL